MKAAPLKEKKGLKSVPGIVIEQDPETFYPFPGDNILNDEQLTRFFQAYADGQLEKLFRSEPVPAEQEQEHVVR